MNYHISFKFFLLPFFLNSIILTSCIHFNLGETDSEKAKNLSYNEPKSPFVGIKNTESDSAWQSNNTGNIIALSTNCSKKIEKPLALAFLEISKGFDKLESNNHEMTFFNGREALKGFLKGTIDGISVSMDVLVFNKNQCYYQLTYSGVSDKFNLEKSNFQLFIEDFKAP